MCLLLLLLLQCDVQQEDIEVNSPFLTIESKEIQSLIEGMSVEEKIGQLIILDTKLSAKCNEDSIYTFAKENHISGVILSDIDVIQYMRIIDNCTAFGKQTFLHGTKENVSICNQFSNTLKFPSFASIASCRNDSLVGEVYRIFEDQLNAFNFHFAIGPNISQYNNQSTFDVDNFSTQAKQLGYQAREQYGRHRNSSIFSIANSISQFFDTRNDSITIVTQELSQLNALNKLGLSGVLIDPIFFKHEQFQYQSFDFLKEYLDTELNFHGLLISEIQDNSVINILHAGTDIIIVEDVRKIYNELFRLHEIGFLTDEILDEKVARILKAKKWIEDQKGGKRIDVEAANFLTHYEEYDYLIRSLDEQSIAVANNYQSFLPIRDIANSNFVIHNLGKFDANLFKATFAKFANFDFHPRYDHVHNVVDFSSLLDLSGDVNIYLYNAKDLSKEQRIEFIDKINGSKNSKSIVVNFGNPLSLAKLKREITSIQIFDNTQYTQSGVAQLLFGAYEANGIITADVNEFISVNSAYNTPKIRLKYADPREVGIDPTDLVGIDAIVNSAMRNEAIPGCQVLVAKSGKIIYSKGFGFQTYDKLRPIMTENLYDLASITKIAATTLGTMKLEEQGKIGLTDRLKNAIDISKKSRLRNIYLRDLLLHRSNLQPNMPIADFVAAEDSTLYDCGDYYCYNKTDTHTGSVAKDFYINKKKVSTLWDNVYALKPYKKSKYRYSDVNFNILKQVVEENSKQDLDTYVDNLFYKRLGLRNCKYKPLDSSPITDIVPTEFDKKWRKQVVHGFVHDESAAILGGVAGNAGLFSNAEDLAYLFQMLLNGGNYGGHSYLKKATIDKFVTPPYYSRRGYGFDKPRGKYTESCSSKASKSTYGHSGFTGTCVWVDPESELIYIFLSNRIYPSIDNRKIFKDKYRGRIHSVIYEALNSYEWLRPDPNQVSQETKSIQS